MILKVFYSWHMGSSEPENPGNKVTKDDLTKDDLIFFRKKLLCSLNQGAGLHGSSTQSCSICLREWGPIAFCPASQARPSPGLDTLPVTAQPPTDPG